MDDHISEHFVPPKISIYDGTTNADDHVKVFTTRMAFRTGDWAICFGGLKAMYGQQFANYRSQDLNIFELCVLKKGKDETLKAFMDRYQKMVQRVKGLNSELALQYALPALKPGPFNESVCRRAPKTLEESRERAADEIRVEEMRQSYRKEIQEAKEKSEDRSQGESLERSRGSD
ncbi:uncharacterized protein LOC124829833 [Vigna umbellata]|uniref:uncharacterized protein LOC124829833 n=1 Tax=Vigna umbellata TaxID=87088 RepID=UPI001F5F6667|nr:uncharacterized protein LOC124829833 [Vigna umbellata]